MKCPHCLVEFYDRPSQYPLGVDADGGWILYLRTCPACGRYVIELHNGEPIVHATSGQLIHVDEPTVRLVWPRVGSRSPCPTEVPHAIAEDYREACLVLADSPKASAALSRRCLQSVLREAAKAKPNDLSKEIQEVLDRGTLPIHVSEGLDAVRAIGNFAAHPIKSQHTGEVLAVEPGEAEWNLDVLESLFEFYYVQPTRLKAKKDALNKKLQEAGKPPVR